MGLLVFERFLGRFSQLVEVFLQFSDRVNVLLVYFALAHFRQKKVTHKKLTEFTGRADGRLSIAVLA